MPFPFLWAQIMFRWAQFLKHSADDTSVGWEGGQAGGEDGWKAPQVQDQATGQTVLPHCYALKTEKNVMRNLAAWEALVSQIWIGVTACVFLWLNLYSAQIWLNFYIYILIQYCTDNPAIH